MKAQDALRLALRKGARLEVREPPQKSAPPPPGADLAVVEALKDEVRELAAENEELRKPAPPKKPVTWTIEPTRDHNEVIRRIVATSERGAWEFVPQRDRDDVLLSVTARPIREGMKT